MQAGALEARRGELEDLTTRRREAETLVQRARSTRAAIDELYDKRLGSESARLTAVMLDVKRLAQQAGLSGIEAINYGDEEVRGLPLVKKSITFGAQGSYQQLRAFINLLELSPSFMSLDEIPRGGESAALRLQRGCRPGSRSRRDVERSRRRQRVTLGKREKRCCSARRVTRARAGGWASKPGGGASPPGTAASLVRGVDGAGGREVVG